MLTTMTVEEMIKASMARMLAKETGEINVVVIDYIEYYDKRAFYGCETCGPEYEEEYTVDIVYTSDSTPVKFKLYGKTYTFKGKFTDLIKELDTE